MHLIDVCRVQLRARTAARCRERLEGHVKSTCLNKARNKVFKGWIPATIMEEMLR